MTKFTMDEHDKRMEEIRTKARQPGLVPRPNVLQGLLDRARQKRRGGLVG